MKSDFFPVFIDALFAVTNGYLASCAMMLGPTLVSPKDSRVAGTVSDLLLDFGAFRWRMFEFSRRLYQSGLVIVMNRS